MEDIRTRGAGAYGFTSSVSDNGHVLVAWSRISQDRSITFTRIALANRGKSSVTYLSFQERYSPKMAGIGLLH